MCYQTNIQVVWSICFFVAPRRVVLAFEFTYSGVAVWLYWIGVKPVNCFLFSGTLSLIEITYLAPPPHCATFQL